MAKRETLRCLAIRNPFAWAICAGEDTVENRSWPTDHRGTIAILASTNKTGANGLTKGGVIPTDLFTFGAIIGLADIEDVIEYGPRVETNPWACGPFCWLMTNPRFLERPIPLKGKLNLFYLPDDVAKQVLSQPTHQLDRSDPKIRKWCEAMRPAAEPAQNYLAAAEEYWEAGNAAAAEAAALSCLHFDPCSGRAYFIKGLVAFNSGADDVSFDCFQTALDYDSTQFEARTYRGMIQFRRGNLDLAESDYRLVIEQEPEYAIPYVGCASIAVAREAFHDAIELTTKAIELLPELPRAYLRRAEAHLGLGDHQQAIADATQAIRLDPLLHEALAIRSKAYAAEGEATSARRGAKRAEQIRTDLQAKT